jgi:formate/nitrite transporter
MQQADQRGIHPASPGQKKEAVEDLEPMGQEAPEIVDEGAIIGEKRLERPLIGDAMTSFIGGMSISFGAVALAWAGASMGGADAPSAAHLVSALAFPIGFVILLVGKSELFTENFFLPVSAVLERRGTLRQLLSLWGVSLMFNLLGSLLFAVLIARPGVLGEGPAREMIELAQHKVEYSWETAFVKALFGGWLMTIMTWLVVAAEGLGPRLMIIWGVATLIVLAEFNHVVISAAEIFMAMFLGADITVSEWFIRNFVPALFGNVIGGVVFVTLLSYIQARYTEE